MATRNAVQKLLARVPAGWAVALVFGAFIVASLLFTRALPPPRNPVAECAKQCAPRHGRLANDMNYPMSAKGEYRQVCNCT
jgi:hypothetical protein